MAWRRGTQNQQAGAIRKGHVKEFLVPSSKALAASDEQCALKILCAETIAACDAGAGCAFADFDGLPPAFRAALRRDGCAHVPRRRPDVRFERIRSYFENPSRRDSFTASRRLEASHHLILRASRSSPPPAPRPVWSGNHTR